MNICFEHFYKQPSDSICYTNYILTIMQQIADNFTIGYLYIFFLKVSIHSNMPFDFKPKIT